MPKLKPVEVRGRTVQIEVDLAGTFSATIDGETVTADSRQALIDKLTKALAPARRSLDIRFVMENANKIKRCTITGIHAGNGNPLGLWEDGKRGQIYSGLSRAMEDLSEADLKKVRDLYSAVEVANKAYERFCRDHSFNVQAAITKVITKVTDGA